MKSKIRLVVVNEYALGYILPNSSNVNILASSKIKGAPWSTAAVEPILIPKNTRLASEADFDEYRVSFKGFDDPNYYEFNPSH